MENNNHHQNNGLFPILPSDVLEIIASSVKTFPVKVKGIISTNNNGYWIIKESEGKEVSIEFDKKIFNVLPYKDKVVVVNGVLKCSIYKNGIYPKIHVRDIELLEKEEAENIEENILIDEIRNILSKVNHYGFYPYLEKLVYKKFENGLTEKIKLLVIHGRGAQTHRDFENGLRSTSGEFFNLFDLNFKEVTLSVDKELADAIEEASNTKDYDMIFIVRGGGDSSKLEKIGGKESITKIAESRIPVYCAIGHSFDRGISLLEKASQYSFSTPSLAGTELGKAIKVILENLIRKKKLDELHPERTKALEEKLNEVKAENRKLKILLIVFITIVILIVVLGFFKIN